MIKLILQSKADNSIKTITLKKHSILSLIDTLQFELNISDYTLLKYTLV